MERIYKEGEPVFIKVENGVIQDKVEDGVYKLFSDNGEEYEGFITVVQQKIVEARDTDSFNLWMGVEGIKIADVPRTLQERKALAYEFGYFTNKESYWHDNREKQEKLKKN